jgi:hypothetical protein
LCHSFIWQSLWILFNDNIKIDVKTVGGYGELREFFFGLSPENTHVLSQVDSCRIFGGERGTETDCSSEALVYPA